MDLFPVETGKKPWRVRSAQLEAARPCPVLPEGWRVNAIAICQLCLVNETLNCGASLLAETVALQAPAPRKKKTS